jgi:hypothetical protein
MLVALKMEEGTHEPRNAGGLGSWKDQEMASLELWNGTQPCKHIAFSLLKLVLDF